MSKRQRILRKIKNKFSDWKYGYWNIYNLSNLEKLRRFRCKIDIKKI